MENQKKKKIILPASRENSNIERRSEQFYR